MPIRNSTQSMQKRYNTADLDERLYSPAEEPTRRNNYTRRRNTNAELIHTDGTDARVYRDGR